MAIKKGMLVELRQPVELSVSSSEAFSDRYIVIPEGFQGTVAKIHDQKHVLVDFTFALSAINSDGSVSLTSKGPRLVIRDIMLKRELKEVKA